jgi:hypothetical protein
MGVGLAASSRRVLVALFACALLGARTVSAQPSDTEGLAAARALFSEALRDEEAGRFADALQKFQRVREVRDTAPVEYRIGSCHEGLGHRVAAYAAYRDAVALGQDDANNLDVVRGALDRLDALGHYVARLTLVLPEGVPPDTEVRIDDAPVPRTEITRPVPVEPGAHVVTAVATDTPPFRSEIVLPAGAQASMTVSIGSAAAPAPRDVSRAITGSSSPRGRTAGFFLAGAGTTLVAAAVVLLVAREDDIATLDHACPAGACPPGANAGALESTRNRALVEGPVAGALGGVGAALVALGAYFVLSARAAQDPPTAAVGPLVAADAFGLRVIGSFR